MESGESAESAAISAVVRERSRPSTAAESDSAATDGVTREPAEPQPDRVPDDTLSPSTDIGTGQLATSSPGRSDQQHADTSPERKASIASPEASQLQRTDAHSPGITTGQSATSAPVRSVRSEQKQGSTSPMHTIESTEATAAAEPPLLQGSVNDMHTTATADERETPKSPSSRKTESEEPNIDGPAQFHQPKKYDGPPEVVAMFKELDFDNSGTLDNTEIRTLAHKLGRFLTRSELDRAMCEMDADGSGEIEFEEFRDWWAGQRVSKSSVLDNPDPAALAMQSWMFRRGFGDFTKAFNEEGVESMAGFYEMEPKALQELGLVAIGMPRKEFEILEREIAVRRELLGYASQPENEKSRRRTQRQHATNSRLETERSSDRFVHVPSRVVTGQQANQTVGDGGWRSVNHKPIHPLYLPSLDRSNGGVRAAAIAEARARARQGAKARQTGGITSIVGAAVRTRSPIVPTKMRTRAVRVDDCNVAGTSKRMTSDGAKSSGVFTKSDEWNPVRSRREQGKRRNGSRGRVSQLDLSYSSGRASSSMLIY